MTASVTHSLPLADAGGDDIKRKLRGHIARRNLAGAANDCKWNELLAFMRGRTDWVPSYRYGSVSGYVSRWDTEWDYHPPFPFLGVEWFDISLYSEEHVAMLLPRKIIDHGVWIVPELERIGFDFEVRDRVARIWAYLPRNYDDFPPAD